MLMSTDMLAAKLVIVAGLLPAKANVVAEMSALAEHVGGLGAEAVGSVVQRRGVSRSGRPGGVVAARAAVPMSRVTYIGSGKARELAQLCALHKPHLVVFHNRLDGTQRRSLARLTGAVVVGRFELPIQVSERGQGTS